MEATAADRKSTTDDDEPTGTTQGAADAGPTGKPESEKTPKKPGSYTVFEQTDAEKDLWKRVATDVEATNDRKAIESVLPEDGTGTFAAVPRFAPRTVEPQQITKRVWA